VDVYTEQTIVLSIVLKVYEKMHKEKQKYSQQASRLPEVSVLILVQIRLASVDPSCIIHLDVLHELLNI
jgi:hypothetical protein